MFGFLQGPQHHRVYRQIYAQCCSSLRDQCGYRSLPFVSYEAIFAAALAVDRNLVDPPPEDGVTCCRMSSKHSLLSQIQSPAHRVMGEYFASFAILLAWVKLTDDIQDSGSMVARLGRSMLRKAYGASQNFFQRYDSCFQSKLDDCLNEHAEFERRGLPMDLDCYTQPTGEAFATVFQVLPIAIADQMNSRVEESDVQCFASVGRLVGQSLIAFDCAVDFSRDRKRGHYNPLGITHTSRDAFDYSQQKLVELGWRLASEQPDLICPTVVQHRLKTISVQREHPDSDGKRLRHSRIAQPASPLRRGSAQNWIRPLRLQRGFCDCDCACDGCGECFGGTGHAVECCNKSSCGCDCCAEACCSGTCDSNSKTKNTTNQLGATDSTVLEGARQGKPALTGEVTVALTPYGTVKIVGEDGVGREEPAKCDSGAIEVGEKITVIRKEAFGLLVRRITEKTASESEPSAGEETLG